MHGGALMTLADSLGAICAYLNLPEGARTATIESKTNFFRGVREGHVDGVARPLHVGRSSIVVQTELADAGGRPVAVVIQTQAVLDLMLIAGNWKMYKGPAEAAAFCRALRDAGLPEDVDVVVCPPYVSLEAAVQALAGTEIGVFAQNCHWEAEGAFTGEVSAAMLHELGVYGTLVGHSERRQWFGETDESAAHARAHRARRGAGRDRLRRRDARRARGGGDRGGAPPPGRRARARRQPRDRLRAGMGDRHRQDGDARDGAGGARDHQVAARRAVLYGGSVKPENAAELLAQPAVDGALVGGASLDVDSFAAICRAAVTS